MAGSNEMQFSGRLTQPLLRNTFSGSQKSHIEILSNSRNLEDLKMLRLFFFLEGHSSASFSFHSFSEPKDKMAHLKSMSILYMLHRKITF